MTAKRVKFINDVALGMFQQSTHLRITNVDWTTNIADVEVLDDIGKEQLKRAVTTKIGVEQ